MSLSKSYYTVDGEILGERTVSGRVNYGVDALGSVTSTLVGDAVQNRYAYKPYGSELSRSGAGSDPSFRWVGTLGYRQTGRVYSESYVRARHYAQTLGRWTTVDPVGYCNLHVYDYGFSDPISKEDSSGLWPLTGRATCFNVTNRTISNKWCDQTEYYTYAGGVFCNAHPGTKACPRYTEGMTASWPNVILSQNKTISACCKNGKTATSKCVFPDMRSINQPNVNETVQCGTKLRVTSGSASIVVEIISAGPAAPPAANALIDLTQTAAKAFSKALGRPWKGCAAFAVDTVTVAAA